MNNPFFTRNPGKFQEWDRTIIKAPVDPLVKVLHSSLIILRFGTSCQEKIQQYVWKPKAWHDRSRCPKWVWLFKTCSLWLGTSPRHEICKSANVYRNIMWYKGDNESRDYGNKPMASSKRIYLWNSLQHTAVCLQHTTSFHENQKIQPRCWQ